MSSIMYECVPCTWVVDAGITSRKWKGGSPTGMRLEVSLGRGTDLMCLCQKCVTVRMDQWGTLLEMELLQIG